MDKAAIQSTLDSYANAYCAVVSSCLGVSHVPPSGPTPKLKAQ